VHFALPSRPPKLRNIFIGQMSCKILAFLLIFHTCIMTINRPSLYEQIINKFHPEILTGSPRAGASNKSVVGKICYFLALCIKFQYLTRNSAKLTNQRVSYAFTSSPFSIRVHHILPTSKLQHSYSCILLIFYRYQWTECVRTVSVNTVHWFDTSSSRNPHE